VLCPERTLQWESPVSYDFLKGQEATARRMFPQRSFQIASGQTSLCHRILLSTRCFPSHSKRHRADLSEFQPEDFFCLTNTRLGADYTRELGDPIDREVGQAGKMEP
jgi:hypothetical protein